MNTYLTEEKLRINARLLKKDNITLKSESDH